MQSLLKDLISESDALLASVCLSCGLSSPGLLIFVFHGLFESDEEIAQNIADPQQAVTTTMFRAFADDIHTHGYRFVSPAEVIAGLNPTGRYAMISFDDGYANNRRALPVMEEFRAPAVFCISVQNVAHEKPFWWDVLYREARQRNWPEHKLDQTRASLKRLRTVEIEQHLIDEFGEAAFRTVSDTDRPFTVSELAGFARHPLVHIGNHTCDHAILTNYLLLDALEQIRQAQHLLREMIGASPQVFAYPNGSVSKPILRAVHDAGLVLGMTGQPGRNTIASTRSPMRSLVLKRHMLWGSRNIARQCQIARSPFSLHATLASLCSKAASTT